MMNPNWLLVEDIVVEMAEGSDEFLIFQKTKSALDEQFKTFKGQFTWDVPLRAVLDIAEKDKRVKSVSIYREFPSRIRMVIEPHTPILAFLSKDNKIYPIATDATLLPSLPQREAPDMPLVRGEELKEDARLREIAIELFNSVPIEGPLQKKTVSEIVYSKKDGFKVFVSGATAEVKLGDADFGPKISRVQKVLSYLDSQNIKGRVIDARFSKKVVVRVRNTP